MKTPAGNVMWDCTAYIDDETISYIKSIGGLKAIVISHPHFYTTHLEWARVFGCEVYISREDEEWLCRRDPTGKARHFIDGEEIEVGNTGVKAIKLGGHFPGSLVCIYDGRMMVADTLLTTPAGIGDWKDKPRPKGMNSYAYMWSIPNVNCRLLALHYLGCIWLMLVQMIPLPPSTIEKMWSVLKKHEFRSTHGAFMGHDVVSSDVRRRVLESMQIQIRGEGYMDHALLNESWDEPGSKTNM
jgi:hypothetical protein